MSIAALRLSMPKQNLHISRDTTALYRDILVNQVLNAADIESNFEKVASNLRNLNRMPLNGDARLNLTESLVNQYFIFIQQVRIGARKLSLKHRMELPELNREFAYACKLLLRDAIPHSKEELANFVYWALSAMCEQLQDYSQQHRGQPGQLWAEINRLYQYAEARYLTDFHSNSPDNRDIESRYKQALLFQAAQPEHFNLEEQTIIDSYLRSWAFRGQLNHQESREFNNHYFYVDLSSEYGVLSARQAEGAANDDDVRALNPLPIIDQARQHMAQIKNGTLPKKMGFTEGCDQIDAFMTLKKALLSWKQSSSRRFERASCSMQAKTAFGLTNIHQYLRAPKNSTDKLIESETVNISKSGACVKINHWKQARQLAVGDAIVHRHSEESVGRLAVVKWLKRSGEAILFGIQYIVGNLQPVTIRVKEKIAEALLVSTSDNDSLFTHKGYCASNTPVKLKNARHGIALDARAQALIQRGQHIDQIRLKRSQFA